MAKVINFSSFLKNKLKTPKTLKEFSLINSVTWETLTIPSRITCMLEDLVNIENGLDDIIQNSEDEHILYCMDNSLNRLRESIFWMNLIDDE